MSEYNYKEEANKLKEKRNLIFDPIRSKYSNIYKLEKMLSEIYSNNLETYKKIINKVLDKVENNKKVNIKDPFDLDLFYCCYLSIEIQNLLNPPRPLYPPKDYPLYK